MKRNKSSKHLSMPGTICVVRECLYSIPELVAFPGTTQSDYLMSGLAVFNLKILSRLKFDELYRLNERTVRARNHNAQSTPEFRHSGLAGLL